ncbi:MAG: hypothetical protein K8F52_03895 [Candidatus Scalindua rubra]|nr:hypothetical protein [Candidatus Scalindua rubra]
MQIATTVVESKYPIMARMTGVRGYGRGTLQRAPYKGIISREQWSPCAVLQYKGKLIMKKIIAAFFIIFFFSQQATFAEVDKTFWDSYQDILNSVVTVNTFTSIDGDFHHTSVNYEKIKNNPELQKKIRHQREGLETVKSRKRKNTKLHSGSMHTIFSQMC